jgi:UDP-N-acetyl-2-amino-2-deoxyglucuronate dehydrogenase
MGDRKVRFGVLGCGAAGQLHALAIARCPETELVLVADVDARAAGIVSERFRVPFTCSSDELLQHADVEAVSIALPHHLHHEYGMRAGECGKHAIIEKPFTTGRKQALELIEAFEEGGLLLSAWLERRYHPFVVKARQLLEDGLVGKIIYITINVLGYKQRSYWEYGMRNESVPSHWRKFWETSGGGPLMMNGIHQIDLIRYITGLEVAEVYAKMATFYHDVEVEDTISVLLEFDNGALGRIDCSCAAFGAGFFPIQHKRDYIYGTDGYIFLSAPLETYDRMFDHRVHEVPGLSVVGCKIKELGEFASAVLNGGSCGPLAREIVRSQDVISAAYQSARTGRPVRLNSS